MRKIILTISVLALSFVLIGQGCAQKTQQQKDNIDEKQSQEQQEMKQDQKGVGEKVSEEAQKMKDAETKQEKKEQVEKIKEAAKQRGEQKREQKKKDIGSDSSTSSETQRSNHNTTRSNRYNPSRGPGSDSSDKQKDESKASRSGSTPEKKVVNVSGTEYDFSPSKIQVKKGQEVTVNFTNEGNVGHNLVIPELKKGTSVISSGETESFTFTAPKSGTLNLEFECTVPGHAQSGMVGEIDVK